MDAVWRIACFFFSSRRRHTRFDCDWSSDVCSSDLAPGLEELGDALAVALMLVGCGGSAPTVSLRTGRQSDRRPLDGNEATRSEEHTSELQSQSKLLCRLLLEKKTQKV